ncbi:TAXI family TRAP transporter solute-binding subunit [Oceanospirillum sp.]|uniref:TAXI family TRAP transporter solute-binding subunit n=1 Tax=Oceanospirillum sp. TaxID=2021254 RepID=UPI003A91DF5C
MLSYRMKNMISWFLLAIAGVLILFWGYQKSHESKMIRIATASKGGYYYQYGTLLKRYIEKKTDYTVQLLVTRGSVDNRGKLLAGEADFAIVGTNSVSLQNLYMVAPLWRDYMHLVVRKNSDINSLADMAGNSIALGKPGSGYRAQSMKVLDHFALEAEQFRSNDVYFTQLLSDASLEGAIVTTGLLNPDLRQVMASGLFKLVSLEGAEGYALNHSQLTTGKIPAGVYSTVAGPAPAEPVATTVTYAVMAARPGLPEKMVQAVLDQLNSDQVRADAPVMLDINPTEDSVLRYLPLHSLSNRYYNPFVGLDNFSRLLGQIAEHKVLILEGLIIFIVVVVQLSQLRRRRIEQVRVNLAAELESVFRQTVEIERNQKDARDWRLLKQYLVEVMRLKQQAVTLVQGSELAESMLFLSTIQQCADVMRQLEWRLSAMQLSEAARQEVDAARSLVSE